MDKTLKLLINTLYGDIASRYFSVGKTVVANNITARARGGVWPVAKALYTRQSITDGGIYQPQKVSYFAGEKPGLDTLSRMWEWHAPNRRRWFRQLPWDWKGRRPTAEELDLLAKRHIDEFWTPFDLPMPFAIEHKVHTFKYREEERKKDAVKSHWIEYAAYWSKGDYVLMTQGRYVYRLRGKERGKFVMHPTYTLLENVIAGSDQFPEDLSYETMRLLSIGEYVHNRTINPPEAVRDLLPGDEYLQRRAARYNNVHFPLNSQADFLSRTQRKKFRSGKAVEWFERDRKKGTKFVHRMMQKNTLR
jgi:hypothetical protein